MCTDIVCAENIMFIAFSYFLPLGLAVFDWHVFSVYIMGKFAKMTTH